MVIDEALQMYQIHETQKVDIESWEIVQRKLTGFEVTDKFMVMPTVIQRIDDTIIEEYEQL